MAECFGCAYGPAPTQAPVGPPVSARRAGAGLRTLVRPALALAMAAALSGCLASGQSLAPAPVKAAAVAHPAPSVPVVLPPGPASKAARGYYARVQANLVAQGLMRTDGGGPDTPFTARQLAENFIRIALYDEYVVDGGTLVAQATESRLRRWSQPIRLGIEFGASVPLSQRVKDRNDLAAYGQTLARLTGQPIRMDPVRPNFTVLMLNEEERRAIEPRLRALVPGIDATAIRAITGMPPATYCLVFAFSKGAAPVYTQAVAVIRGEHPDLLRLSCIHEEIAQGLGLANDSPRARPSIFNDDEEFALLTRQDELLLKMLYDPRLKPGMTPAEALPIAETIASELLGGAS